MDEYQIDELSNKQLKLGYWYITHRDRLKKTGIILLGLAVVVIWTVVLFGLVKYVISLSRDSGLVAEIVATRVDYESFFARNKPQDLTVAPAEGETKAAAGGVRSEAGSGAPAAVNPHT